MSEVPPPKTPAQLLSERLDAAVQARAARADRDRVRDAERLILVAELEDKCAKDYGEDQRGSYWEVKDLGKHGVLAMHRIGALVVASWEDAVAKHSKDGSAPSTEEQLNFVEKALIYPPAAEFRRLVSGTPERPGAEGLAGVAVFELRQLHGHFAGQLLGKN
jgi:hypothetical protein